MPIAFFSGYGQLLLFARAGVFNHPISFFGDGSFETLTIVVSFVGGTMLLVWMGELITERGVGNGISLIIFAGIVSGLPSLLGQSFLARDNISGLLLLAVVGLVLIFLIVVFNEAQRRIPVQYGRSVFRGGRMYRQTGATHLPLRVNSAGMIPLIFAFSIMVLPGTVANFIYNPSSTNFVSRFAGFVVTTLSPASIWYWVVIFILVVIFTFFYTLIVFQQQQLAENLQKNGGFVPGIRPGRSYAAVPEPRHRSDHVGRRTLPGNRRDPSILLPRGYRSGSVDAEQHQPAHHRVGCARLHASVGGAAADAELRRIHPMTARVVLLGAPGAGKGHTGCSSCSALGRRAYRIGRSVPQAPGRRHGTGDACEDVHGQGRTGSR